MSWIKLFFSVDGTVGSVFHTFTFNNVAPVIRGRPDYVISGIKGMFRELLSTHAIKYPDVGEIQFFKFLELG
jgi:hypothetical protein